MVEPPIDFVYVPATDDEDDGIQSCTDVDSDEDYEDILILQPVYFSTTVRAWMGALGFYVASTMPRRLVGRLVALIALNEVVIVDVREALPNGDYRVRPGGAVHTGIISLEDRRYSRVEEQPLNGTWVALTHMY
jgi:hypothetical protein